MAKRQPGGDAAKKGRTWDQRKEKYQSIAVHRDVARMAARVAKDEGMSVAELTEPLLRGPLAAKYKRILERELRSVDGESG